MALTNAYTTLALLKTRLNITDTTDDTALELAINGASRQIDSYCGRRFWQDATVVTREYFAHSATLVETDDISTVTGLIVKTDSAGDGTFATTTTITTDFIALPVNAADRVPVWPYEEILLAANYSFSQLSNGRPGVQVTARFGWPAVPDDVKLACEILALDLFKAKDAPFGVAGSNEFGALRVRENRLARSLLEPYTRPAVA